MRPRHLSAEVSFFGANPDLSHPLAILRPLAQKRQVLPGTACRRPPFYPWFTPLKTPYIIVIKRLLILAQSLHMGTAKAALLTQ